MKAVFLGCFVFCFVTTAHAAEPVTARYIRQYAPLSAGKLLILEFLDDRGEVQARSIEKWTDSIIISGTDRDYNTTHVASRDIALCPVQNQTKALGCNRDAITFMQRLTDRQVVILCRAALREIRSGFKSTTCYGLSDSGSVTIFDKELLKAGLATVSKDAAGNSLSPFDEQYVDQARADHFGIWSSP